MSFPVTSDPMDLAPDLAASLPLGALAMLARARVEVDVDALAHNVAVVRRLLPPGTRLLAVVKGDAYGLGAVPAARSLLAAGADWLGAASVAEAVALREAGIGAPLLVFDPPVDDRTAELWPRYRLAAMVGDPEALSRLSRAAAGLGVPVDVHVEVDLGFGRCGVHPERAASLLHHARQLPGLRVQGLAAHLPAATRPREARRQLARFRALLARLEEAGLRPPLVHCAESALLLQEPGAAYDMVRVGNLLYGFAPRGGRAAALGLRETRRLRVRVLGVTEAEPGSRPGYRSPRHGRRRRLALLGVGFADGVALAPAHPPGLAWCLRLLARGLAERLGLVRPRLAVRVGDRCRPLRGELMMNHALVDVTGLDLRPGDEVELVVPHLTAAAHLPVLYRAGGRVVALSWPERRHASLALGVEGGSADG